MDIDLAIPAYNEEDVILPTILFVSSALEKIPRLRYRIIVAENGSSDRTFEVVSEANLPHVTVFRAKEKGKGTALKEAAERSDATYFGFIDADCSPDPISIRDALAILEAKQAGLAIGSRFHRHSQVDRGFIRHSSSRAFNLLARAIVGIGVDDTQCPLKLMSEEAKKHLIDTKENTWLIDLEHIARVERSGIPVATFPVVWTETRYPGRKSKLKLISDGKKAVIDMIRLRKRLSKDNDHGT